MRRWKPWRPTTFWPDARPVADVLSSALGRHVLVGLGAIGRTDHRHPPRVIVVDHRPSGHVAVEGLCCLDRLERDAPSRVAVLTHYPSGCHRLNLRAGTDSPRAPRPARGQEQRHSAAGGRSAPVVQRTGHRISNPEGAGSNPAGGSCGRQVRPGAYRCRKELLCLFTLRSSERSPGHPGGQWVHGVIGSAPRLQRDDSRFESGWIHQIAARGGPGVIPRTAGH